MNFDMFYKKLPLFEGIAAMVAFEWSLPSVLPHVALQITRDRASVVALVAFERFFFCMLPNHMNFQMTSLNARIIAFRQSESSCAFAGFLL